MAANLGSVTSPLPATASLVGNTFVNKYYNVLHQSPEAVYRFYTDRSILSRAEAGANGAVDIVITQAGINQKIMSLDYIDFRAEIKTVDSLESLTGSVLVMVTGSLSSHGRPKRNFVQTFFLAPQEVGYFVLNDMFRYLDGEEKPAQHHIVIPNGTVEQHVPACNEGLGDMQPSSYQETREFPLPLPEEAQQDEQQNHASEMEEVRIAETGIEEEEEESSPPQEVDAEALAEEQGILSNEETNAEEAPKKSYASIVRIRSDASGSSTPAVATGLKPLQSKNDRHATSTLATHAHASITQNTMSDATTSNAGGPEEGIITDHEGDGRSIYIKNLPLTMTQTELEDEFKKFGPIKPGGATLRNQRAGVCFAFIEYEEASSAQSAIEASPISVGGRQVYVEEKKPMPIAQRSFRGRFNQSRGYQYDGLRGGRGYFGGRGFGRGSGQDYERDGGRGGGAGRGNYGGGNVPYTSTYGSNFNTVNGYRRTDSQGWSGSRPMKRGVGNQGGRGRGQGPE